VQELEGVDGARFNDVLGERLHLAAIAVHAGRHPALPLNLHRIINVNRLAIEKHFAGVSLRQRLRVIKAYILNEFFTQLRTENVSMSVDDASSRLGLGHLDLLEMVDELELSCCSGMISLSLLKATGASAIKGPLMLTLRATCRPWSRAPA
jgi:hypothetical protein